MAQLGRRTCYELRRLNKRVLISNPNCFKEIKLSTIVDIIGREVIDSRGNPTVECDVLLEIGRYS